jgi:arabinose-5-phosphate isomerase
MQNRININEIATIAIQNEGKAILNLLQFIDQSFEAAIQAIANANGRVVITGIGKSAIVAQKIVSTLNSTGVPSLFMHAADAIHGDLGMIQNNDVVIIISKSGESPEIKVLLPLVKNFGNTIIGMVGNVVSYLAQNCTYVINTTIAEEACPNNLAPTTSTTAQMVMGDVVAICLMQINGFKKEHFAKYHPGGALGKQLYLTVADLYANNMQPKVPPTASFKEIVIEISSKRLGATAVVNPQNQILGIITDGDIRRAFEKYDDLKNITAQQLMGTSPKTIEPDAMAIDALQLMKQNDITQLIVIKENEYLGMVHLHEIIKEGVI